MSFRFLRAEHDVIGIQLRKVGGARSYRAGIPRTWLIQSSRSRWKPFWDDHHRLTGSRRVIHFGNFILECSTGCLRAEFFAVSPWAL